jgi:ribosomal protein L17
LPVSAPANNYGHYEGSMSNHDKIIDNVVKTLLGEEKIMTNASDGVEVVNMIESLYSSAQVI